MRTSRIYKLRWWLVDGFKYWFKSPKEEEVRKINENTTRKECAYLPVGGFNMFQVLLSWIDTHVFVPYCPIVWGFAIDSWTNDAFGLVYHISFERFKPREFDYLSCSPVQEDYIGAPQITPDHSRDPHRKDTYKDTVWLWINTYFILFSYHF